MKTVITLLLCMLSLTAGAQVNPERGYIITCENDTLWGMIDNRTEDRNWRRCSFKQDGSETWEKYTPALANGYRLLDNDRFYVSKILTINNQQVWCFAEYMVKGALNLYYIPGERYFFENERGEIAEYYFYLDESMPGNFKEEKKKIVEPLQQMMKKSPAASKMIKKERMEKKQLIEIAQQYNEDIRKNGEGVDFMFDTKNDRNKLLLRAFAGMEHTSEYEVVAWGKDVMGNLQAYTATTSHTSPVFGIGADMELNRVFRGLVAQLQAAFYKESFTVPVQKSKDYIVDANVKNSHICIDAGLAYYFGAPTAKVKPCVRAGMAIDRLNGETTGDMPFIQGNGKIGMYGGAGVLVQTGKLGIELDLTYRQESDASTRKAFFATLGIRIPTE